ncbi:MAG: hypothetical protein JRI68_30840 [Deltaproteobacteria bacterium]|nr:hypothetical protein [Deltaproteobacteria bacterium]
MISKTSHWAIASTLVLTGGLLYACGDTGDDDETGEGAGGTSTSTGSGVGGGGGSSTSTSGDGGMNFDAGDDDGGEQDACAAVVVEGNPTIKPADIIFVIDNSCSMGQEINGVEQNINVNFAQIMGVSQVDYRIIMVTDHGSGSLNVCIGALNVQSWDSACKTFNTFYGSAGGGEADQHGLYPNGWSALLRTEAIKVFVEITDDRLSCTWQGHAMQDNSTIPDGQNAAVEFDSTLLGLSPGHFGTASNRNYMFYSIVGLIPKSNPLEAYSEFDPVVTGTCSTAPSPGTGYQWLSKGTHALRFPVCEGTGYDVVFQDIAAGVVEGTQVPCEIEIPEPPPGETYDWDLVSLLWTPGGGSTQEFTQVTSLAACGTDDDKFYIEDNLLKLCPAACDKIEADLDGTLEVKIPCEAISR